MGSANHLATGARSRGTDMYDQVSPQQGGVNRMGPYRPGKPRNDYFGQPIYGPMPGDAPGGPPIFRTPEDNQRRGDQDLMEEAMRMYQEERKAQIEAEQAARRKAQIEEYLDKIRRGIAPGPITGGPWNPGADQVSAPGPRTPIMPRPM